MARLRSDQAVGIALGMTGGLAISIDIPVIRLAGSDPWFMMMLRGGVSSFVLLMVFVLAPGLTNTPRRPFADKYWLWVAILYGLNGIFFALAVFNTTTANVVFILAFNPMVAAILAWWMIGERPKPVTWLAIALTIIGVGIIVQDGLTGGGLFGDMMALACAFALALTLVVSRKSGGDMSLAPGFGGMVAFLFALPPALFWSDVPQNAWWAVFNAGVIVPLAVSCLALAPRYIPAPQAALFFLLETVLTPVWVWMIFGETISPRVLAGGLIVLVAITGHSLWQLRGSRVSSVKSEAPA